jgi:hypothetical protein
MNGVVFERILINNPIVADKYAKQHTIADIHTYKVK